MVKFAFMGFLIMTSALSTVHACPPLEDVITIVNGGNNEWELIGGSLGEMDQIASITDMHGALNNDNKPRCFAGLADDICYALMARGKNCTTTDWDLICIASGPKTTLIIGKKKVWQ